MEEDQAGRRRPEEEGSERWEEAGREDQLSWVWANRVEGDQQDLLMGLSGQESREAAGPVGVPEAAGPEEAEEPRPTGSGGGNREGRAGWAPAEPRGGARAAPEGGAAAGPEGGRGGEGRGERDGVKAEGQSCEAESIRKLREELRSRAVPEPGKLRERYWEGTQERYREREVKRRAKGTKQVENKYQLEKKPNWLKDPRLVETEEKEVLRVKTDENLANWASGQQSRRPTIRVNVYPRPHLQSQWSIGHHSVSVIKELAKMGDPDVLEMVQEEGRSRRTQWRGGGSGWARRDPGGRWRPCGLDPGDVHWVACPARDRGCKRNSPRPRRVAGCRRTVISSAARASRGPASCDRCGSETAPLAPVCAAERWNNAGRLGERAGRGS